MNSLVDLLEVCVCANNMQVEFMHISLYVLLASEATSFPQCFIVAHFKRVESIHKKTVTLAKLPAPEIQVNGCCHDQTWDWSHPLSRLAPTKPNI